MPTEIGAYEAKTRLPELLRQVRKGKSFTITHRWGPIAATGPGPVLTHAVWTGSSQRGLRTRLIHSIDTSLPRT